MADDAKSLRTPLGQARFLGPARSGADESWMMHATSVALTPLTIAFVWIALSLLHKDYNGVRAELAQPVPAVVLLLFVLVSLYHLHIGMRSVIIDYVHGHARAWALIASAAFSALLAAICAFAALRIAFT